MEISFTTETIITHNATTQIAQAICIQNKTQPGLRIIAITSLMMEGSSANGTPTRS